LFDKNAVDQSSNLRSKLECANLTAKNMRKCRPTRHNSVETRESDMQW